MLRQLNILINMFLTLSLVFDMSLDVAPRHFVDFCLMNFHLGPLSIFLSLSWEIPDAM